LFFFPLKNTKNSSVAMLCNDFLNSLEEKITAHYGTIYLISFTKVKLFGQISLKKEGSLAIFAKSSKH